jgi:hypothetical protein
MHLCVRVFMVWVWERESVCESPKKNGGGVLARIEVRLRDLEPCSALLVYEALSN